MITIAFFWVGENTDIPVSLVKSVRLVMGHAVNLVQLTNRETKEIEDCTVDKDGFDYCLVKPIYDENIKKYNGETVTIMGYMFPLEESEKQKKFLIGPYPLSCPFHYHVGPSQVIEIKSNDPVDFSFDPITIKGKLKVKYNKETGSFFYLETINS